LQVAVPSEKRHPLVFNAATSQAAFNKIVVADIEGRDIPEGWALDQHGKSTTKAAEALNGVVLPFGGYKGSGLAIMVNVLTGILSGAFLDSLGEKEKRGERSHSVGFFFGAIDIGRFLDIRSFKMGIDEMVAELKASQRDEHTEIIYTPGELEYLR
jgi:LDH2 family malate/lactate/ureidoglycolate dehydrogenase